MKFFYKILIIAFITCSHMAMAQTHLVSGVVRDADGPLPGATIIEKDLPSHGTTTDLNGKFQLTVSSTTKVLLVKSVGYVSKEVNIANTINFNIQLLPDAKGLNEVVVIGYGTTTKLINSTAVSSINADEIRQTPSASVQNALSGKIPGFFSQQRSGQPGDDGATFSIRGVSTLSGTPSNPLILVDDVQFDYSQFSNIDPNEIASVTVLKDAASTAIYGIQGANGVVLVTTRRGKSGPAKINFRSQYGIQKSTHMPHYLDAYNTASLLNEAIDNDIRIYGTSGGSKFTDNDLQLFKDGTDPIGHPNNNWYDLLFKSSSPMGTSNFDISGGSDRLKYFVSLGYLTQDGMLRNYNTNNNVNTDFNYKRYNFRSNLDIDASKTLSFKLDISGNYGIQNIPDIGNPSGLGALGAFFETNLYTMLSPYIYNIYNPDGSFGYTSPNKPSPINKANNIIGRLAHGGYSRNYSNLLNIDLSATQKLDFITKGLSLRAAVSAINTNTANRDLSTNAFPSYYYDPVAKTYTPRDASVTSVSPYALTYAPGSPVRQTNIQANLSYNHSFKNHNVSALFLFNQTTREDADASNADNTYIPANIKGYTLRLSYNFKAKYLAEISGGYNGTNRFLKHYGLFPAASVGWNIGEENFVKESLPFINLLKLRGSYGLTGSDALSSGSQFLYLNTYTQSNTQINNTASGTAYSFGDSHNNSPGIAEGSLGNNNITWQKERKADVGLDFSLFKGKLSGSLDYFDNYRYDILTYRQTVADYFGISSKSLPPVNIGEVGNKGYEAELVFKTRIGKVGVNLKGTYSYAKNKIVFFDEPTAKYPYQQQTGLPVGMNKQYVWTGQFYTQADLTDATVAKPAGIVGAGFLKYTDLNGDGIINADDMAYVGNPNLPNTNIGFAPGFTYKGFSLNILLQAALNFDLQGYKNLSDPFQANLQDFHLSRWTPATAATATFPVLVTGFVGTYMSAANSSTFWKVPGDYIRVKSVEMGYEIPAKLINRFGLQSLRIFASGYNLLTWSKMFKRYSIDPESVSVNTADRAYYPNQAIYNLGVNLSLK